MAFNKGLVAWNLKSETNPGNIIFNKKNANMEYLIKIDSNYVLYISAICICIPILISEAKANCWKIVEC